MTRALPPAENERHPALDTFERVLNNGVIVDRGSDERRRAGHRTAAPAFSGVDRASTYPFFFSEGKSGDPH